MDFTMGLLGDFPRRFPLGVSPETHLGTHSGNPHGKPDDYESIYRRGCHKTFKDRQQVITAVLPWAQLKTLYEFLPYPSYF